MGIDGQSITVIGAGVAGLAAARALALRGARVTVFEQAQKITDVGAGLQISPNGMRVISALGLEEALKIRSLESRWVELRDFRRGTHILRIDQARFGGEFRLVHRARLIEILAKGAKDAGVHFRLGARLEEFPGSGLVVGADGLHSITRKALNGPSLPEFTGQVAWRTVIRDTLDAPEAQVFMGPGRHLVSYPLAGNRRNIVAVEERDAWTQEGWTHRDSPEALRAAFSEFGGPVPRWLSAVDDVFLWGLFRHPVADRWHDGSSRVILGDAAHPTLPFLAQGANMALEDAWALVDCLSRFPVEQALEKYQNMRRPRAVRLVDAASDNARNFHLSNPFVRLAAHTFLRAAGALAPGKMAERFDWIYRYDVTASDGHIQ